jgi:predicted flap endonuclease-1-like 5' DNA nuclease
MPSPRTADTVGRLSTTTDGVKGETMAATPDVRPVGDLPDAIGKTAARELSLHGIISLRQVAAHSKEDLLAIHGVGPKAIAILEEALAAKGLAYREP